MNTSQPWFKNYPTGVPFEINPEKYESILELLEECFEKYADLTAFVNMGKSLTYREVDTLSKRFAGYLQHEMKLQPGDRIAIQLPNLLQYPIVLFGALRAGCVVVNTNPLYTPREMEYQFNDAGVKAVIILANFATNLEKIISHTLIEKVIITEIGDMLGGLKGKIVNFVVKYIKKMVPSYHLPHALSLRKILNEHHESNYKSRSIKGKDLAFLQYTGGTTGVSKGAMLSHRNIIANVEQCSAWWLNILKEKEEIVITPLPLYHIFSLTVNALCMSKIGAKNILITNPKDLKGFIKEIKKYPFTVLTGVNTLFNGMLHRPEFKSIDFSHIRAIIAGGMALQRPVAEKWKQMTNTTISEGYGLTETSPVLCCNPVNGQDYPGTIGFPFPNTDLKVIDDDGNDLGIEKVGELCVKGPQVMAGYWNKPEETTHAIQDGWFKTGDIGMILENGTIKIVDRKKDMIVVSGFKVFPNEIEDIFSKHPGVLEVAAIGVPDEKSTEAVKVFIVKKDPKLTEEDLRLFAEENFTHYKLPKYYEFRTELPKTNVGKILRRKLKEETTK